jgi:hypothetical protein
LKFDNDNELEDHALLDVVVNGGSYDDDNIIQDFVWENMENYKGQRENFMGTVVSQGAVKHVTEIVDVSKFFQQRTNKHDCHRNKQICEAASTQE